MSPEHMTAVRLRGLVEDAAPDLEALDKHTKQLAAALTQHDLEWPEGARAAVLAVALHGYYGAGEAILQRVIKVLDGGLPEGPNWHRDLLMRASRSLAGVRPAVISPESVSLLRHLLGFRHFFRHAYAVELDLDELTRHARGTLAHHAELKTDFQKFMGHLQRMVQSLLDDEC